MTYWNAALDLGQEGEAAEQARSALADVSARLLGMQDQRGAWYHEYSNPFVTASCLIELKRARRGYGMFRRYRILAARRNLISVSWRQRGSSLFCACRWCVRRSR